MRDRLRAAWDAFWYYEKDVKSHDPPIDFHRVNWMAFTRELREK